MKPNSNYTMKMLTNPFERYSEKYVLCMGLIGLFVATVATNSWNLLFLGSLKIVNYFPRVWYLSLLNLVITLFVNIAVLYIYALLINRKTRLIDVVNVVLVAHWPMYILAIATGLPLVAHILKMMEIRVLEKDFSADKIPALDQVVLGIFGLLALVCLIYFFYLFIKGLKVATNSKKSWHTALLIFVVLFVNTLLQFINPYL